MNINAKQNENYGKNWIKLTLKITLNRTEMEKLPLQSFQTNASDTNEYPFDILCWSQTIQNRLKSNFDFHYSKIEKLSKLKMCIEWQAQPYRSTQCQQMVNSKYWTHMIMVELEIQIRFWLELSLIDNQRICYALVL